MIRFIHAADIHLDSPLRSLDAYEGAPAAQLRGATRAAFVNLVDRAIELNVDFMLIAGDLYDGNWKDVNTGLFFAAQMGRLARHRIPVCVLYGNHDAESGIGSGVVWPDNVSVMSSAKPQSVTIPGRDVVVHGQSFNQRVVTDNLARDYPQAHDGMINIGMLHTALTGRDGHDSYAPCSLEDLAEKGYEYWALGHVHDFEIVSESPFVVFSGNLQGRHIKETGAKGAALVTIDGERKVTVERLLVDVLRWANIEIDISGGQSIEVIERQMGDSINSAIADFDLPVAARITLNGATPLHGILPSKRHELRTAAISVAAAAGADRIWIEKLKLETSPEESFFPAAEAGAVAEMREILEAACADESFIKRVEDDLAAVMGKLPAALASEAGSGDLTGLSGARLADLARSQIPTLVARIQGGA